MRQHARTGCRTCKARKLKCDEAKPSCRRCLSSRRVCAGYEDTTPQSSITWYRPTQLVARNQKEGRAFQFFTKMAGPVLSGSTDSYFWTHLVMQFSHFEPAVRHAVLSISSLYEEFARGSRITRQICGSTFAIGHYNAAIQKVKSLADEQLILLLCVLFICIEYLQGDFPAALQHCRHGIMILNNSGCPGWARQHLVPIFRRLSLIPFFFGGMKSMRLPKLIGLDETMPGKFSSLVEAQSFIDTLMFRVMECNLDGHDDQRPTLIALLDEWELKARNLEHIIPASSATKEYARHGMQIKHRVTSIYIHKPHKATEMWYDQHLDDFRNIVDLARKAAAAWNIAQQEHVPDNSFTFEMGLLPLTFFAVMKCRNLKIRTEALSLVARLGPAKEGLFDVGTLYRVGRRQIELEHDILLDDSKMRFKEADGPLPPEEQRFFSVQVKHELEVISDPDGRICYKRQVHFLRRDHGGEVFVREEYIPDDKPKGCNLHIPPMRSALRI